MNDDTISKQAAIDVIAGMEAVGYSPYAIIGRLDALLALNRLPSTERHGHWTLIDKGHNFYNWECSICGGSGRGDYAFCPWCGVIMDEDIPIEYFENGGI